MTCSECGSDFERAHRFGPAPKRCPECSETARLAQVRVTQARYRARYPDRIAEYKRRPEVKAKEAAWAVERRAANPEKARAINRRSYNNTASAWRYRLKSYGMTGVDYDVLLASQDGVCAVCHNPETARGSNGRIRRLGVDHDHVTGEVRGLVCHVHNVGLGLFNDDPELLEAAAGYLRAASRRRLHLIKES